MTVSQDVIDAAVEAAIGAPKQVVSGSRSVTQHDPKALADLANALTAASSAETTGFGLRFTKLIPGGGG